MNRGSGLVKKQTVAQLKKKADLYFSKYIRYRDSVKRADGYYCQCITCDKWNPVSQTHAGHFQSRRFSATRYDEENVNAQCASCNTFNAGEQYRYAKALEMKYGDGTAEKLEKRAREYYKLTTDELLGIIDEAKANLKYFDI